MSPEILVRKTGRRISAAISGGSTMKKMISLLLAVIMILSVILIANAKAGPQKPMKGNTPVQETTAADPESEIIKTLQPADDEDPEEELPDEEENEDEEEEKEEEEDEEEGKTEIDQDPEAGETEIAPAEETETTEPAAEGNVEEKPEAEEETPADDHIYDDVIVTIEGVQMTVNYDGSDHIVSGYTVTDISHGEYNKNDFVFIGKAEAMQKDAGVAWMGLNSEMFINKNDRFTSVNFAVIDGFIEVLPATAEIQIVGASETYEYDGNSHSVEGFEMIQLRPAIEELYTRESFEMVGGASDFAEGTEVGRYTMGLNGGSFRNIDPNFNKVIFLVMDGYVEITPSADMMEEPEEIEEPEDIETEVPAETPEVTEEPAEDTTAETAETPETAEEPAEDADAETAETPEVTEEPAEGADAETAETPEVTEEPAEGADAETAETPEVTEEPAEDADAETAETPEVTEEPAEGADAETAETPEVTEEPAEGADAETAETPEVTEEPAEGADAETAETPEVTEEPAEEETELSLTVILPAGTSVYAAPDAASDVLNVLTEAEQVTLFNIDENGWAEIRQDDETAAYVFLTNNEDTDTETADSTGILLLAGTDIREKASGLSGIIDTLEENTEAAYLGITGRWVMVQLPDMKTGFIYYGDINDADIEAPAAGRQVLIFTSRRSVMEFGETINLTSVLEGFDDITDIHYQWECNKGEGFEPVEGATEDHYSYVADPDSISWGWRLVISFEEED